jgi:hypothetical protein
LLRPFDMFFDDAETAALQSRNVGGLIETGVLAVAIDDQ